MVITAEEKLMYSVMSALYRGGIPMSFKGSMVLKACLVEAGYTQDTRHTVDIDASWNSDAPMTARQIGENIETALRESGIPLSVSTFREAGAGRSAGFELRDESTGEPLFTMDVDVNRPAPSTKLYEIEGFRFCGAAPLQILADKVCALSTDKVFRRIKDVVDLYYISQIFSFDTDAVLKTIADSGRALDTFQGFLCRESELRHSYEKFRFDGGVSKPPFEEIYGAVKEFIKALLPENTKA